MDKTLEARLASMSMAELRGLRKAFPDKAPEQALIAPFEHRAFAREQAQTDPARAWVIPPIAIAYAGAKALGLKSGRTKPSAEQIAAAFQGVMEGYSTNLKKE